MDYVSLGTLGIGAIRFGDMRVDVPELADYHLLVFCLSGSARLRWRDGEALLMGSHGISLGPGERLQGEFSADCEQLILRIDAAAMRPFLAENSSNGFERAIDLSAAEASGWFGLLMLLLGDPTTLDLAVNRPSLAAHYGNLILEMLALGHAAPAEAVFCPVPRSVHRAEEYMREHLGDPITLADLVYATATPERTLLENFARFRDRSPLRVLRDMRLDQVHDRLVNGHPYTLTRIALESGFSHLGRFASDYRDRFGVLPSRTMKAMQRKTRG